MGRWLVLAGLLGAAGCKNGRAEGPGDPATAPAPAPEPAPEPVAAPAPGGDPASLYATCRERMESPEAAGECTTDAECATSGCGKEVCTTAQAAADLTTTCEDRPCFKVVEACGCHSGACTWNVMAAMPALPPPLPRTIPSGGPAPAPAP